MQKIIENLDFGAKGLWFPVIISISLEIFSVIPLYPPHFPFFT